MDSEEVRNELLAEIHNRLAEISKFLEIGIAMFAKLDTDDLDMLKIECKNVSIRYIEDTYRILQDDDSSVGCNSAMGLFREIYSEASGKISQIPLGEDTKRTHPIDEKTGCFLT